MSPLGVVRLRRLSVAQLAATSCGALDRSLAYEAELLLGEPTDEGVVLGSMQRASEIAGLLDSSVTLLRRGSGGAEAHVGPGTLWLQLALARPNVLVACEPSRLLNRHVRPLLRGLAKVGVLAHYFDRDWISAGKRPVGTIAFGHDSTTGRSLVEVILAVDCPFGMRARPSYRGSAPTTLALGGARVDMSRIAEAVTDAYASAYKRSIVAIDEDAYLGSGAGGDATDNPRLDPPWAATREEAIGVVAAGRDRHGRMRVGGELMASRDAIERLEGCLAQTGGIDARAIGSAIDESLGAPEVALLGVRSLASLRDVIADALALRG